MKKNSLIKPMFLVICMIIAISCICPIGMAQQEPPMTNGILRQLGELKAIIEAYSGEYDVFTDTNTEQQASAIYNKIDVVTKMVEQDNNYRGAINKLENDISPKLNICTTTRDRARSWLSEDPELQDVILDFEDACQSMIEEILSQLNNLINS